MKKMPTMMVASAVCAFASGGVLPKTDRDTVNAAMIFACRQWIEKKTFDNSFRYGKGKGFYCTELVLCAYDSAGIKLLPDVKDGDRIFPSEVIESGCVSKIAEWGRPK